MKISQLHYDPDHRSFLNYIHENPHDTTARLVYADWLEEQGFGKHADALRGDLLGQKENTRSKIIELGILPYEDSIDLIKRKLNLPEYTHTIHNAEQGLPRIGSRVYDKGGDVHIVRKLTVINRNANQEDAHVYAKLEPTGEDWYDVHDDKVDDFASNDYDIRECNSDNHAE